MKGFASHDVAIRLTFFRLPDCFCFMGLLKHSQAVESILGFKEKGKRKHIVTSSHV